MRGKPIIMAGIEDRYFQLEIIFLRGNSKAATGVAK